MNPIFRPGLVLGLASLVPIAAGCHSLGAWSSARPKNDKAPSATSFSTPGPVVKTDASVVRSDFHREVTPLQQFNVHVEVGRAQEAQEHYEEAIGEYQKAIEACQRHNSLFTGSGVTTAQQALAQRRLAAALDHLGRFAQAEVHYREALKLSPNDPKVWNDAGYSCYVQGRWDDAIRNLKMADKLDPGNLRVQTNLGLVLAASGKNDEALTALTRAGGSANAHANMAFLMAAQGKTDQARKHYQTALTLKPDLASARQALAALDARDKQAKQLARINAVPTAPTTTTALRTVPTAPAARTATGPRPTRDTGLSRASTSIPMPRKPTATPAPSAPPTN